MTVTSSFRSPRCATPVKVAPALVVLPFLTPAMPLYGWTPCPMSPTSSRLVFWMPKLSRFLPFFVFFSSPGNWALGVEQYSRKSAFWRPERAKSVRSYALETCPGSS